MPKDKDDKPSVADFVKAFQAQQAPSKANLILAGMVIGYALRRNS